MVDIICAVIAAAATIICGIIAVQGKKREEREESRAERRAKEAKLYLSADFKVFHIEYLLIF